MWYGISLISRERQLCKWRLDVILEAFQSSDCSFGRIIAMAAGKKRWLLMQLKPKPNRPFLFTDNPAEKRKAEKPQRKSKTYIPSTQTPPWHGQLFAALNTGVIMVTSRSHLAVIKPRRSKTTHVEMSWGWFSSFRVKNKCSLMWLYDYLLKDRHLIAYGLHLISQRDLSDKFFSGAEWRL